MAHDPADTLSIEEPAAEDAEMPVFTRLLFGAGLAASAFAGAGGVWQEYELAGVAALPPEHAALARLAAN